MAIAVYCVGSDATRVARALASGRRRVSCTRLPPSPDLVLRSVRTKAPDLVVLGGDAGRAAWVAERLLDEPGADALALVAWMQDVDDDTSRLAALGVTVVRGDDDALRRACEELLDARDGRTARIAGGEDGAAMALHGRRVLVADDDPAVAWYFGDTLRRAGCDVEEASDGWSALDKARRFGPEVVLADIRMPGLDGLRLCRALRADPALGDVPILLLSWKADWFARAREAEVGASGFLVKHAVPEEVLDCVRVAIERVATFERRFHDAGPVRGLLGDVSMHRVLRLACAARPNARITVQAGTHAFEVHLRGGNPARAVRVSAAGDELRGVDAIGALLALRAGRFVVTADHTPVDAELTGTLHQLAAPHVARAREAGPHPTPTPSIPIVFEPTATIRVDSPADESLPVPLVTRTRVAAVVRLPRGRSPLASAWRATMRALSLAAVAAAAVALGSDSRTGPADGTATAEEIPSEPASAETPAQAPASQTPPLVRAARTSPLRPR
jgi:CheY-like chemotaxis protein